VPFSHILGQTAAVETLTRALSAGRVHHAYLFEGPEGVGREMAAIALAEALIAGRDAKKDGDERRRVRTFGEGPPAVPLHPDFIVVERGLYPPETIGRSRPELTEISVDQVKSRILTHASFAPHEGKARVFMVRRADELSVSAANALLKTLEEPRRDTHFVLLSAKKDKLLPTILSRTLPVRFGPLPHSVLVTILTGRGVSSERAAEIAELAGGSASAALALAEGEEQPQREAFVTSVLEAVAGRDLGTAVALGESVDKSRELLAGHLRALSAHLARASRACVDEHPDRARRLARQYEAVLESLRNVEQNASATLTTIDLVSTLRRLA
jgi:DNA polymerase-3 subunit delta'